VSDQLIGRDGRARAQHHIALVSNAAAAGATEGRAAPQWSGAGGEGD
jgi:hypothetical protein